MFALFKRRCPNAAPLDAPNTHVAKHTWRSPIKRPKIVELGAGFIGVGWQVGQTLLNCTPVAVDAF